GELTGRASSAGNDMEHMSAHLRELHLAQRELLPPVVRMQSILHPWVAFGIMPLFALANAGISVDGIDLSLGGAQWVAAGVMFALVVGKPVGIVGVTWLLVRLRWCALPPGVTWGGIWLIGLLAGVGFTMSMFIAMLAFTDANLLGAAKLGVLLGSVTAAALGMIWGTCYARRLRAANNTAHAEEALPARSHGLSPAPRQPGRGPLNESGISCPDGHALRQRSSPSSPSAHYAGCPADASSGRRRRYAAA